MSRIAGWYVSNYDDLPIGDERRAALRKHYYDADRERPLCGSERAPWIASSGSTRDAGGAPLVRWCLTCRRALARRRERRIQEAQQEGRLFQ